MTNKEKLDRLQQKLEKNAPRLPLSKTARDIVFAEGNPQARLMFIGEAAGYHEYLERRPFVGAAGQLLTKSLEEIGIKRDEVWISNILKVRPPQNRDPLPEEIEAYKPYLDTEIQIIKPQIIITLGRFSMAKFLPKTYITRVHGQAYWVEWEGRKIIIFPMFHPAAALRSVSVMETFKQDFAKLESILNALNNKSDATDNNSEKNKLEEIQINQQLQMYQ